MPQFSDALRGYAFSIHQRDGFRCRYCGLDGTKSFDHWAALSWDHLLPRGHHNRDNRDYIVTACRFCNTADNRYFDSLMKRGLTLDNLTPEQLISQRKPFVEATRKTYDDFWRRHVLSANPTNT
jgi:hypothetical protein